MIYHILSSYFIYINIITDKIFQIGLNSFRKGKKNNRFNWYITFIVSII